MSKKKSVVHQFITSSDISNFCVIVFSVKMVPSIISLVAQNGVGIG